MPDGSSTRKKAPEKNYSNLPSFSGDPKRHKSVFWEFFLMIFAKNIVYLLHFDRFFGSYVTASVLERT